MTNFLEILIKIVLFITVETDDALTISLPVVYPQSAPTVRDGTRFLVGKFDEQCPICVVGSTILINLQVTRMTHVACKRE